MNVPYPTVVELETDAGITGIGETLGTEECFALATPLAKSWLGRDARDRLALRRAFSRSVFDNRNGRNGWSAFAGLELAAWDVTGKAWGVGLADMMGGAVRRDIEVVCPLPAAIVAGVVSRAALLEVFRDPANGKVVLADLFMWGGISNYRIMADVAAANGLEVAIHSLFETGIGTMANLHLAAAIPQVQRANDSGHHVLAADVLADDMPIRDGRMRL